MSINIILRYILVFMLLIMIFTLVILKDLDPKTFEAIVYLILGAMGGYHTGTVLTSKFNSLNPPPKYL